MLQYAKYERLNISNIITFLIISEKQIILLMKNNNKIDEKST